MSFGIFEAAVTSEYEVGLAKQASTDRLDAAVYDVREKLGAFLFAAESVEEFRDRVAMTKNDNSLFKIIEAHLPPVTGTVRRIAGKNSILEREFKQRQADMMSPSGPGTGASNSPANTNPVAPSAGAPDTNTPAATPAVGYKAPAPLVTGRVACYPGCEKNEAHAKKFHSKDARRRQADGGLADPTGGLLGETVQPGVNPQPKPVGGLADMARGDAMSAVKNIPGTSLNPSLNPHLGTYDTVNHPKWDNGTLDLADPFKDEQGKELKPKGDWAGYRNKMDNGAPEKVKRNFASKEAVAIYTDWCKANNLSPIRLSSLDAYATGLSEGQYFRLANVILAWENEHHPKVPSTDLKKKTKFAAGKDTVAANGTYSSGDDPYRPVKSYEVPDSPNHSRHQSPDWEQQGQTAEEWNKAGRPGWDTNNPNKKAQRDPMRAYVAWCNANGYKRLSANNINHYAQGNPRLAYYLAQRAKQAIKVARQRQAGDQSYYQDSHWSHQKPFFSPNPEDYAAEYAKRQQASPLSGFSELERLMRPSPSREPKYEQKAQELYPEHFPPVDQSGAQSGLQAMGSRRRTAAPDYLQKADDALTQLLNQKAQEFQEVIAPLQQALMTVQQATQLQQQQNPLNVLPTPGTVNVMPGQQQTPAQVGMPDPNAPDLGGLAQMLAQPGGGGAAAGLGAPPGGVADDQSGPPPAAAGGGLPPGLDPSAQRAARRGKGRGVTTRPRQAAGVGELFDKWKNTRAESGDALRGDPVDYARFQQETGAGDRALNNLKTRNQNPDYAPINGVGAGREPTVGRRQMARWDEEHEYMGTSPGTDDFHTYGDGGATAHPDHPGVPHGWKGQFDKDQYAPYTGEYYSKGDAHVRGGPGPEGSKYYLHTPNGRTGPHGTPEEAFKSAEPYLGQKSEMDKGQGALPLDLGGPPGKAAMRDFPKGRKAQGKGNFFEPNYHPLTPMNWESHPDGGLTGSMQGQQYPKAIIGPQETFSDGAQGHPAWFVRHKNAGPDEAQVGAFQTPQHAQQHLEALGQSAMHQRESPSWPPQGILGSRKAQRKQAWSGWGPSVHPKVRQVTGWKWDNHLNGYTASRPERFACDCGKGFQAPSGFQRCACGKQWNSYVIGSEGTNHTASAEKYLVREIPARHDVIVANRKMANYEDMSDTGPQPIVGKPADSDYHLDRGNNSAAWALQKEKQHGKPLSQFSDDDWAIAGNPPGRRATVKMAAVADYTKPWTGDRYKDGEPKVPFGQHPGYGKPESWWGSPDWKDNYNFKEAPEYQAEINRQSDPLGRKARVVQLVDPRTGKLHNLVDPGELGEGEESGTPSMKYPPKDWARRGDGAKWQKSPIGK